MVFVNLEVIAHGFTPKFQLQRSFSLILTYASV